MNANPIFEISKQKSKRAAIIMITLLLLVIILFVISMNTGHIRLTPLEVFKTLFGYGSEKQSLILYQFRLPRIVIAILIGAGLAVSGCILQGISRNALADPGILGINAGAGLTLMLYLSFFPAVTLGSIFAIPLMALAGSALVAIFIYVLSYKRGEGISPTRLLLTGIAAAAGISAITIVLTLKLDPQQYQFIATWMAGSIWGSNWKFVWALLPWTVILIPLSITKARTLNVLSLGEQTATGLGAVIEKDRRIMLAIAVGLAGTSVAVSGGIGFVGLIGPHLARRLVGPRHQLLIPASALTGSLLVLTADTIGRILLQPSEIPAGIVVAVIGAPYFLYLMSRK